MRALCSISSIEFNVEHFPGYLSSREVSHPIFYLPQKKLLGYMGKWSARELTPTDSYLLFLALLNSTELVHWRVPIFKDERTDSLVSLNMESLALTVSKLNTVYTPSVSFPNFATSPDNRHLHNVHHWIEAWAEAYNGFKSGRLRDSENRKLAIREKALERLIKNPHKTVAGYARSLADWAADAGSFPTFNTKNPYSSNPLAMISCADYWKSIIIKAASQESIYAIDRKDIIEILEHCEENIPIGSIYSNALFTTLRTALEKQRNYLGLGDIDLSHGKYSFLSPDDSIESANMRAMIDSAPSSEPKPESYPTKLAYLRAKMRWEMARSEVSNLPDGV